MAKFRHKNLDTYSVYYKRLFGDCVAVCDRTTSPYKLRNTSSRVRDVGDAAGETEDDMGENDDSVNDEDGVDNETLNHKDMDSTSGGQKIVWDSTSHAIFVECCIEEVNKGNKPGSHFNRIGWKNLIANFNARAGKNCTKLHLKSHWDVMKKSWKLWDEFKKTESRITLDPVRKIIVASPKWWDEKIRVSLTFFMCFISCIIVFVY